MGLTISEAERDFEKLRELSYSDDTNDMGFESYDYIYPFTNDRIKSSIC